MAKKPDEMIMKGFRHEIDCHDKPIEIVALADLHVGDENSDKKLIKKLINEVKNNENRYAVLVGDLMNTGISNSKSDVYVETLKPSEQLAKCYDLLSPISDKILAVVPGNHEERITRSVGVDMTGLLAAELGIPHLYSDSSALVILRFGNDVYQSKPITYSIYINHGHGGGRRVGGKLNSLQDLAGVIDADCFICGHTHLPASFKQQTYRLVPQKALAVLHEQLFVNTASSMKYGGYGKRAGYVPASNSYPIITMDNRRHHMTVTL